MENKLQDLTRKLYEEGLEKGRAEAGRLVEDARAEAEKIVRDAKAQAESIEKQATAKAEELTRNTRTELALASRQSVAALKEMIASMITASTLDKPVAEIALDAEFIKQILLEIVKNWNGASAEKIELTALLPASMEKKFGQAVEGSLGKILGKDVELKYSNNVKSGFKIGPKQGGYHISFTDEDFRALIGSYLRPKAAELLYGEK